MKAGSKRFHHVHVLRSYASVVMEAKQKEKMIWTIGHSTRSRQEFLAAIRSFDIEVLADVRRFPGSKKYPQFNVDALEQYLPESGISYLPQPALGGRRKPKSDSDNLMWRNESFRGYADHAETGDFRSALSELMDAALQRRVAYMCSEAVWWRCHRAIISDFLKAEGWTVMHILRENEAVEHPFTSVYRAMHKCC